MGVVHHFRSHEKFFPGDTAFLDCYPNLRFRVIDFGAVKMIKAYFDCSFDRFNCVSIDTALPRGLEPCGTSCEQNEFEGLGLGTVLDKN